MAEAPCSCPRLGSSEEQEGAPRCCERFERWVHSSSTSALSRERTYSQLLETSIPQAQLREVLADVERTCPGLTYFQLSGGRQKLTNVLTAWVAYDADSSEQDSVGYVQGMSAIASHLLWHAREEEAAFWVFVAMMRNCGLQGMFAAPDMAGLRMRIFVLTQLLFEAMPDLGKHLAEHLNNDLGLVMTDWLVTLFAGFVPLDPLALLWDRFFKEGYTAIYRLVLARLRCLRPWLLAETDFSTLARLIKATHIDFHLDAGSPKAQLPENAFAAADESLGATPTWTCLACNGSESCGSWEMLVALVAEERVWGTRVAELERMFTGDVEEPAGHGGSTTAATSSDVPCEGEGQTVSTTLPTAVAAPAHFQEYIFALETENAQLRSQLGQAKGDMARLQNQLAEAQAEIARLQAKQ